MRKETQVTVNFGPFKGRTGTISSVTAGKRIVVRLVLAKKPILIELDKDMVDHTSPLRRQ